MTQAPPLPLEAGPAIRATAEALFALEPQRALYVPRQATIRALQWLASEVEANTPLILLSGPPGIGKSLILQRIAGTASARVRCLELSAARESLDEIERLARAALEEEAGPPAQPPGTSRRLSGLVLLVVDDAESLPEGGLGRLLQLALESEGHLQTVAAASAAPGSRPALDFVDPRIAWAELSEPMNLRETFRYVRARLERVVAPPELCRRFGPVAVTRLWRESAGNPARLHVLARRRLRLQPPLPETAAAAVLEAPRAAETLAPAPEAARAPEPPAPAPEPPRTAETRDPDPEPSALAAEPVREPRRLRLVSEPAPRDPTREALPTARVSTEVPPGGADTARPPPSIDPEMNVPPAEDHDLDARPDPAGVVADAPEPERPRPPRPSAGGIWPVREPHPTPGWLDDASALRLLTDETLLALTPPDLPMPTPVASPRSTETQAPSGPLARLPARLMILALSAFLLVTLLIALDMLVTIGSGSDLLSFLRGAVLNLSEELHAAPPR